LHQTILPRASGKVRVAVLTTRQWQGSRSGSYPRPTLEVRSMKQLSKLVWNPQVQPYAQVLQNNKQENNQETNQKCPDLV